MKLTEATNVLREARWTFAKTMAWVPHYYTLKKDWADQEQFVRAAQFLDDEGVMMTWGQKAAKRYLDIGDWRYWHMSSPAEATLINRELISGSKAKSAQSET
tara:strand:- start:6321 stop:6626 length:306 start_codon:yes stop_codon:yes gene_type:complete